MGANSEYKGLTFMISIGCYGGFYASAKRTSWRLCLGWIAFTVIFCDFEMLATDTIKKANKLLSK